jgi:ABC-type transporter Mla subunit MlaD
VYQLLKLSVLTRSGQVDENSIAVVAEHLNNTLEKLNKFDDADRQVSSIKTATKKLEDVLADLRDEIGTELKSAQRALQSTEASDETEEESLEDLAE